MKVLIIGGVAAGASAAARLRRLNESAEIILFERGEFISYANCGLPYHLGGVILRRESLLVMSKEKFSAWLRVDVRTHSEVIQINRAEKSVLVRNEEREYTETYDKILLASGSSAVNLNTPGDDDPRVTHLWTLADMDRIQKIIAGGAKDALVVGAGFIGLETAENLKERGMNVTLVQRGSHVLPTIDGEMSGFLEQELTQAGIRILLNQTVTAYENGTAESSECAKCAGTAPLTAILQNGERLKTDLVIVGTGVRPNSELAQNAGLECGPRGHIVVNERLETSDPDIYAAGDAVEVVDPIFGAKTAIPLAGPANKQGRIAADNLSGGNSVYRGTLGASVVKVGNLTAGSVGWTESRLREMKKPFQKIYLHPASKASYFPGGNQMHIKLMFSETGAVFGAQIVGGKGVDKRIDAIAQAIRNGLTAPELGTLELAYAPPYNSAKDPVNFAGFIASNVLSGISRVVHADAIPEDALILDVREPEEHELGAIPGAVNIRLGDVRERMKELDPTRKIVTACQVGLRGYLAERILRQNGFDVYNLSGGYLTWKMFHPAPLPEPASDFTSGSSVSSSSSSSAAAATAAPSSSVFAFSDASAGTAPVQTLNSVSDSESPAQRLSISEETLETLDVRGLPCPGPVITLKKAFSALRGGERLRIFAALTFENDLVRWVSGNGYKLLEIERDSEKIKAIVEKSEKIQKSGQISGSGSVSASASEAVPGTAPVSAFGTASASSSALFSAGNESVALVLFSNDLDKALAAFIIANGFAASGVKVSIFFTFWGLSVLRKEPEVRAKKNLMSRMFGWMLPKGPAGLRLSKMNMSGIGTAMMKKVMKDKNVMTLPELIRAARENGVTFVACEMAMDVMGISRDELMDVDEVVSVATFVELAKNGKNTLFI